MKKLLSFFLLLFSLTTKAQLSGVVLNDKTLEPIPYANISWTSANDSLHFKGVISDSLGRFRINTVELNLILKITSIGYKDFNISINTQEFLKVMLEQNVSQLAEVIVNGTKPTFERKADRLILNLNNAVKSPSTWEVIRKAPNIIISPNGGLTMYGKSGVRILMDDNPLNLEGSALVTFLKTLNPSDISKIEFISNPSSEYDAQGSAGIINIVTKKETRMGFSGIVYLEFLKGAYNTANFGGQFGYKGKKFSIKGGYGFQPMRAFEKSNTTRLFPNSLLQQTDFAEVIGQSHALKLNIQYLISKKSEINFDLKTNIYAESIPQENKSKLSKTNELDLIYTTQSTHDNSSNNLALTLNYVSKLNQQGNNLRVNGNYVTYDIFRNENYVNNFLNQSQEIVLPTFNINTLQPNVVEIKSIKADLTLPYKPYILSFGVKSGFVQNKSTFNFYSGEAGNLKFDTSKSNDFIYNENINSLYGKMSGSFKKGDWAVGIRGEQTQVKLNTKVGLTENNYLNIFPNFSVNYKLDSINTIGFSYSKRIGRPYFQDLAPFIYFVSPFQSIQGNPNLQPQITNTWQLNYTFKQKYTLNLLADFANNVLSSIPEVNSVDRTTVIKRTNLQSLRNFVIEVLIPIKFSNALEMNISANTFYKQYTSILQNQVFINELNSFQITSNSTLKLPKNYQFEFSAYYISPFADGVYRTSEIYSVDLGIRKTFFKKYNVSLLLQDAFRTYRTESKIDFGNQKITTSQRFNTQIFSLSLSYKFSKGLALTNKNIDKAEETKRVK